MNLFNKLGIATLGVVVALGAVQEQASASFRSCSTSSYDISGNVTGTANCTISDVFQDSVSPNKPLTVNEEGFFGYTNWEFGGKIGSNAGYDGTQGGQSGSWDISR